jgi:hypothetical protein
MLTDCEVSIPGELHYAMTYRDMPKLPGMSIACHTLIPRFLDHGPSWQFSLMMAKQQGPPRGRPRNGAAL